MNNDYRTLRAVRAAVQITYFITSFLFGFFTSHYFVSGMEVPWELAIGIGSLVVSAILLTVFCILTYKFNKKH